MKLSKAYGWFFLALWALLIIAGIMAKRVWGHPDWMVFFHLPAAVSLVLSFYILSSDVRARYKTEFKRRILRRKQEQS